MDFSPTAISFISNYPADPNALSGGLDLGRGPGTARLVIPGSGRNATTLVINDPNVFDSVCTCP